MRAYHWFMGTGMALVLLLSAFAGGYALRMHYAPPEAKRPPKPKVVGAPIAEDVQNTVAQHEAGHAIAAAYLYGSARVKDLVVNEKVEDSQFGSMHYDDRAQLDTADDIMRDAIVSMAGRAGDVVLGSGPNDGASADLDNVTTAFKRLYAQNGLGGSLLVRDPNRLPADMIIRIENDINNANTCAEAIVRTNRRTAKDVAKALMSRPVKNGYRTLSAKRFRAVLAKRPLVVIPAARQPLAVCRPVPEWYAQKK